MLRPLVLVVQKEPLRRARWAAAMTRAGWEPVARPDLAEARVVLRELPIAAIVAQGGTDAELAELWAAHEGRTPPPTLLVGAPYGERVTVRRGGWAVAVSTGLPPPDDVAEALRALLAPVAIICTDAPLGRADFPLRVPAEPVAKWKGWLYAEA